MQKEVEAAVSLQEDTKLNLLAAVDALKIEVEVLKRFMAIHHADFSRRYPELRDAVMRQVDPEWMQQTGRKSGK